MHHSDDRPTGMPRDPRLLPGVPVLRRDADHLHRHLHEEALEKLARDLDLDARRLRQRRPGRTVRRCVTYQRNVEHIRPPHHDSIDNGHHGFNNPTTTAHCAVDLTGNGTAIALTNPGNKIGTLKAAKLRGAALRSAA